MAYKKEKGESKKVESSTNLLKLATRVSPYRTAKEVLSWRQLIPNPAFYEHLSDHLLEWVELETSISITEFLYGYGMSWQTFNRWVKTDENLKEVYDIVREKIGSRREQLAIYKDHNCDANTLQKTLRNYDPEWRAIYNEDIANKKAIAQENQSKITVIEIPQLVTDE